MYSLLDTVAATLDGSWACCRRRRQHGGTSPVLLAQALRGDSYQVYASVGLPFSLDKQVRFTPSLPSPVPSLAAPPQVVDAVGVDQQPRPNHNPWMGLFVIGFVFLGSFFWLNLLVSVRGEGEGEGEMGAVHGGRPLALVGAAASIGVWV